jgi:hypothetical protein
MEAGVDVTGGDYGLAFDAGETITVRPYVLADGNEDDATVYIDHLVFIPTWPQGKTNPLSVSQSVNFGSSGLGAYGYEPSPTPGSMSNPVDDGWWISGDTVDDTQTLPFIYDSAMHMTVQGHDESDIEGLFTGVGSVHVYVLCRITGVPTTIGGNTSRWAGHVTCYTGAHDLSDIYPDEGGGWCWAYAGEMPLGDSAQAAFGMSLWIDDGSFFFDQGDPPDSVRIAIIAYVPATPCIPDAFLG